MGERVLMIDDDVELSRMLGDYLGGAGYAFEARHDVASGLRALRDASQQGRAWELLLLDLMLPDGDGLEACRGIRADADPAIAGVPIIMLTARGEAPDRIVGLELGADDYLPKPFDPRELLARMRALARRRERVASAASLRFGRLEIDPAARTVRVDGSERPLTAMQFDLLLALAESAGRVLSRDALMQRLRGHDHEVFDRSIDVHVSRIRAAVEDDPKHPRRLLTVRGVGYVFASRQDGESPA